MVSSVRVTNQHNHEQRLQTNVASMDVRDSVSYKGRLGLWHFSDKVLVHNDQGIHEQENERVTCYHLVECTSTKKALVTMFILWVY
jgi:hypothetical protein